MGDTSISRRTAIVAAAGLGTVAVANAGDEPKAVAGPAPFKISITLTDGQVVNLTATEAVIDFGQNGHLLVKSTGVMPTVAEKAKPKKDNLGDTFEPKKI